MNGIEEAEIGDVNGWEGIEGTPLIKVKVSKGKQKFLWVHRVTK
jgi:hypothetical protein